MTQIVPSQDPESMDIETCIQAWIAEKVRLSGSAKTEKAYRNTVMDLRTTLRSANLDVHSGPGLVAPLAQGWANNSKVGRTIAWTTYNQRLAILSSFYEYAARQNVRQHNPIERVKRAKRGDRKNRASKLSEWDV